MILAASERFGIFITTLARRALHRPMSRYTIDLQSSLCCPEGSSATVEDQGARSRNS